MNDLVLTNETITKFGDKDVRINLGKVNLIDVAKCCGLTKVVIKNGKQYEIIRWTNKGVTEKLKSLSTSVDTFIQQKSI